MILNRGVKFKNFGEHLPDDLKEAVREVPKIYQLYNSAMKEICTKLEILDSELEIRLEHNPIHHMECRLKSPDSINAKLRRKGIGNRMEDLRREITDIAGIRVVCNYVDDVYFVSEMLCKQSDIRVLRRKDYIQTPKESGYRSLHIVVEIPVFLSEQTQHVPVEIQFRTVSMDVWASLEHEIRYKSSDCLKEEAQQKLADCARRLAEVDDLMMEVYLSCKEEKVPTGRKTEMRVRRSDRKGE